MSTSGILFKTSWFVGPTPKKSFPLPLAFLTLPLSFLTLPFRIPEDRTLDGLDGTAGGKLDLVLNPNRLERLVPPVRGAEVHHHMRRVPDWLNGGHDGTSALGCWVPDGGAG